MGRDLLFSVWLGLALVAATACSSEETGGGGGGGGAAGAGGAHATSSASTTSTSSSASTGTGGEAPAFSFFIVPITIEIPYGGTTVVDVRIVRDDGFDAPVDVKVSAPPDGLSSTPLVLEPGASTGSLEVGASGALAAGATFDLKLVAIAGDLLRVAAVPATVTAAP